MYEIQERTGAPAGRAAQAYVVARDILDMKQLWEGVEALDNQVPVAVQSSLLVECSRLLVSAIAWLIRHWEAHASVSEVLAGYGAPVAALMAELSRVLPETDRAELESRRQTFEKQGLPPELAMRMASLPWLASALSVVDIHRRTERDIVDVSQTYFGVGQRFGFEWLRRAARDLSANRAWDKLAVTAVVEDLFSSQGLVTLDVLRASGGSGSVAEQLEAFAGRRKVQVERSAQLLRELESLTTHDFAQLVVASQQLKSLVSLG
jgi:glutamate dehydrogenase